MPVVKSNVRLLLGLGVLLPALAQANDPLLSTAKRVESAMLQASDHGKDAAYGPALPDLTDATPESRTMPSQVTAVMAEPSEQPSAPAQIAGMGASVPLDALEQYRGGTSVNSIRSEAVSNGLLQDATATNVATGTNTIADGAFSNAIGLPIVIQNSGANVLIQNSTIVNVQFR